MADRRRHHDAQSPPGSPNGPLRSSSSSSSAATGMPHPPGPPGERPVSPARRANTTISSHVPPPIDTTHVPATVQQCFDVRTLMYDGPPMPTLSKHDDFSKFILQYLRNHGSSHSSPAPTVEGATDTTSVPQFTSGNAWRFAGSLIDARSPPSRSLTPQVSPTHGSLTPSHGAPTIAQLRRMQHETGAIHLLHDESIEAAEKVERDEIDFLRDQYLSALKWFLVTEGQKMGLLITEEMMNFFGSQVHQVLFRKMKGLVATNFKDIFREGIEGTSLSSYRCLALVDTLVNLDSLLDADLYSCTFAGIPGIRFTAKIVTTTFLQQFYMWMAVKSSFAIAGIDDRDEWHDHIINYYYGHFDSIPPAAMHAIHIADSAFRIGTKAEMQQDEREGVTVHGLSSASVDDFYQFCLETERSMGRTFADPDNTILIDFKKGELVGRGSFGQVYRCTNMQNGEFLALKEIPLVAGKEQDIRLEVETHRLLSHKNIIRYFGCRFDRVNGKVQILMEFAPKSLKQIATTAGGLPLTLVAHYARRILSGIAYLHEHHIIHQDIKTQNLLCTDAGEVKISDFGTSTLQCHDACVSNREMLRSAGSMRRRSNDGEDVDELASAVKRDRFAQRKSAPAIKGSPLWLSPELLNGGYADEASDIWAFGCCLIELVTGRNPWQELLDSRVTLEAALFAISKTKEPPALPQSVMGRMSPEFLNFLYSALAIDPDLRPSARKLLMHPFLHNGFDSSKDPMSHSSVYTSSLRSSSISLSNADIAALAATAAAQGTGTSTLNLDITTPKLSSTTSTSVSLEQPINAIESASMDIMSSSQPVVPMAYVDTPLIDTQAPPAGRRTRQDLRSGSDDGGKSDRSTSSAGSNQSAFLGTL